MLLKKIKLVKIEQVLVFFLELINILSKKVIPKLGRAISWNNILDSDGVVENDPCSLHIGIKPDSGEKWALTVWSRDRKFEQSSN